MNRTIALLLVLAACGQDAPEEPTGEGFDYNNPNHVARAFLDAYREKNLERMRDLSFAQNRAVHDELIREGEASPRYKSIFGGWRWDAVSNWGGCLHGVRYWQKRAHVKFDVIEKLFAIIKLERQDGGWAVDDVAKVSPEHFASMAAEETTDDVR